MPGSLAQTQIAVIRTPASYELVVDQLRRGIHVGRFLPGEKLPTERELAAYLGVSRTTVREAMRVLQGEGLIETRRGRAGGAVVVGVQGTPAERRQVLRRRLAELENVFDYRVAVEPAAARLAAGHRTKAELGRIRSAMEAFDALGDAPASAPFFAADAEFHHRVAQASHNELLIKAIDDARAAMFLPVGGVFTEVDPEAVRDHAALVGAIDDRDGDAAERVMRRHLERAHESFRRIAHGPREHESGAGARGRRDGRRQSEDGGPDPALPSRSRFSR